LLGGVPGRSGVGENSLGWHSITAHGQDQVRGGDEASEPLAFGARSVGLRLGEGTAREEEAPRGRGGLSICLCPFGCSSVGCGAGGLWVEG